ncbi:MAG: penicillin acylase family protein [Chitinophagaceae bacterium]|nr:MAG: penicillin acylase family protein [Chitinophagaceae bacterium]
MRLIPFIISALLTTALIILFNTKYILPAPLGKLAAPQSGFWQNAEAADTDFSGDLIFNQLKGTAEVYFDERLVPHIFAENENDAYFIQGYVHAKFRLWQMDFQVRAAAGRLSELVGDAALNHDREFRRLGMVYAAEQSLQQMEADATIKASCDAYTAGANAFINSLTEASLPLEYKLMGFKPELWSNLKTALFLKYMSYDLAANEKDFEMTNAKHFFSKEDFDLLYPVIQDSLDPIIPKGTVFSPAGLLTNPPVTADSLYFSSPVNIDKVNVPDPANGSNNWAVSGAKTESGAPILCNDPHLGLNLPSLWYEMQISTPAFNAYGASFPGSPSVIIGFNDSIAFGFTNGGRDVRDYYEIKFKDDSRQEYWFNNEWKKTEFRYEEIKIAGKPTMIDTVAYTIFGPVMFDKTYSGKRSNGSSNYAVRWKAHDASNELLIFNRLNHAKNYADYLDAVVNLHTPGQNVVFASKSGDIAIRTQGEWPAKWKGQGDFVMPGTDSSYMWRGMIPDGETPFQYNPERGFVSSANQRPVDSTYPYYLGREYPTPRGAIINRMLADSNKFNPERMKKMQTDNFNIFAQWARPIFLKNLLPSSLTKEEQRYFELLTKWDLRNDPGSVGATVFVVLWKNMRPVIFNDEFGNAPKPIMLPYESTLLESLLRDSAWKFIDDVNTPHKETLADICLTAFKNASKELKTAESGGRLEWGKFKDTKVTHLARLNEFSSLHLPIGGGDNIINAAKETHGPSWRMIVSLTEKTEAFGIYPGGQSGNPGSKFYNNFISDWAVGKYYTLWMMTKEEIGDKRIKWKMTFSKS